jgi:hypothetical protein
MRTLTTPHPLWPPTHVLHLSEAADDLDTALDVIPQLQADDQRLEFDRPVRFGGRPEFDTAVLRILGAAAAAFVPVDWTLTGDLPWAVRSVLHLPPPRDNGTVAARTWRAHFRFGLCAYRTGPGFISIHDVRPAGPKNRVIVQDEWAPTFLTLACTDLIPTDERGMTLLEQLAAIELALRVGDDRCVVLPYHAYRWPVPGRPGSVPRTGYTG